MNVNIWLNIVCFVIRIIVLENFLIYIYISNLNLKKKGFLYLSVKLDKKIAANSFEKAANNLINYTYLIINFELYLLVLLIIIST